MMEMGDKVWRISVGLTSRIRLHSEVSLIAGALLLDGFEIFRGSESGQALENPYSPGHPDQALRCPCSWKSVRGVVDTVFSSCHGVAADGCSGRGGRGLEVSAPSEPMVRPSHLKIPVQMWHLVVFLDFRDPGCQPAYRRGRPRGHEPFSFRAASMTRSGRRRWTPR